MGFARKGWYHQSERLSKELIEILLDKELYKIPLVRKGFRSDPAKTPFITDTNTFEILNDTHRLEYMSWNGGRGPLPDDLQKKLSSSSAKASIGDEDWREDLNYLDSEEVRERIKEYQRDFRICLHVFPEIKRLYERDGISGLVERLEDDSGGVYFIGSSSQEEWQVPKDKVLFVEHSPLIVVDEQVYQDIWLLSHKRNPFLVTEKSGEPYKPFQDIAKKQRAGLALHM